MVEKIITYALGEHDPGSSQNWRTSNDFCSPARPYIEVHISTGRRSKVSVHCSSGPAAIVTDCSANGSSSHGQGQRDDMLTKIQKARRRKNLF